MLTRLRNWWSKPHKESIDERPPDETTSQQSLDTESKAFLLPNLGLIPPFDLTDYLDLYLTDSLSHALVQSHVNLTVSDAECSCKSDALNSYVAEFNRRIQLPEVMFEMEQMRSLYGFYLGEVIGDGPSLLESRRILGVKAIDPRYIIIQKDRHGRFEFFRQRPGVSRGGGTFLNPTIERKLDPQTLIYLPSINPITSYGLSILQPVKKQLERRLDLIDAAVLAAKNHSNPIIHLNYFDESERPEEIEEIKKRIAAAALATKDIDKGLTRWLRTGGRGRFEARAIGHPTIPDNVKLLEHLTSDIIVSALLSPTALGFSFGERVKSDNQSGNQMANGILRKQRSIMSALHRKLYRLLPLIESETPEGEIVVKLEEPTRESAKIQLEAEAIKLGNVILEGKAGILSGLAAARLLGVDDLHDEQKWNDFISSPPGEVNSDDPNDQQQRRKALTSNNPTGGKK